MSCLHLLNLIFHPLLRIWLLCTKKSWDLALASLHSWAEIEGVWELWIPRGKQIPSCHWEIDFIFFMLSHSYAPIKHSPCLVILHWYGIVRGCCFVSNFTLPNSWSECWYPHLCISFLTLKSSSKDTNPMTSPSGRLHYLAQRPDLLHDLGLFLTWKLEKLPTKTTWDH